MTCAKQVVRCTIVSDKGRWVGENTCRNPQETCPREPGEGYEKCKTVCRQSGHAEEQALGQCYERAKGAAAYLEGHSYFCDGCREALNRFGVYKLVVGAPPV